MSKQKNNSDIFFDAFKESGKPGYYMLYRALSENEEDMS